MKNLLSIFGKMDNSEIVSKLGILNKPGDRLEARITDSNRRVVKVQTDNGNSKYSATQYPNGTLVETKSNQTEIVILELFVIPVNKYL